MRSTHFFSPPAVRIAGPSTYKNPRPASYGRFKGTKGADGDHVDVFVGTEPSSRRVYIIDQVDPKTGRFDERKAFVGYMIRDRAISAYDRAFSDGSGPTRRGAVSTLSIDDFKRWLERDGGTEGPYNAEAAKAKPGGCAGAARFLSAPPNRGHKCLIRKPASTRYERRYRRMYRRGPKATSGRRSES